MNGADMTLSELYRQLCLAADEYTSYRNNMMSMPTVSLDQIEQAVRRGDKVAAFLRAFRGRVTLIESQAVSAPVPDLQVTAPPPGLPAAPPVAPPPPVAAPPPPQPVYPEGTVLAVGPRGPDAPPLPQPCSAWQCPTCRAMLWAVGTTPPKACGYCGVEFG